MTYTRACTVVNLEQLVQNIKQIKLRLPTYTKLMVVVKADAYGHGAVCVSNKVLLAGADCLGVATVDEGLELREKGINASILVLGAIFESEMVAAISNHLTPTVHDEQTAKLLSRTALLCGKQVDVHIKIDTGMARLGFALDQQAIESILAIAHLPNIHVVGLYSHLATSDAKDKTFANAQRDAFLSFSNKLALRGFNCPTQHIANSGGALYVENSCLNIARVGILAYGLSPTSTLLESEELRKMGILPILTFKSRIVSIKQLEKNQSIGYGRTFFTKKQTTVAVVSIGYADGYSRALSNVGFVLIGGKRCPIVGNICMDQMMVDVSDVPHANIGDEVVLFGEQLGQQISVEEVASWQNTIDYEVVTQIGKRVPRLFL